MPLTPPTTLPEWMRWIEGRITLQERRETIDEDSFAPGVPDGGTAGQVLAKESAQDFDTHWVDAGGGGGGGGLLPDVIVNATSYVHHQASAATVWTIDHMLGFYPNVQVEDSALTDIVPGNVEYANNNTIRLYFSVAVGGTAYLS